ncbi:MAG: hypothetical protein FLDDKLPJ_01831 [Phycisphaerae bacterium]|nr:hypothetical protein [Phycisphaerae bacterium]
MTSDRRGLRRRSPKGINMNSRGRSPRKTKASAPNPERGCTARCNPFNSAQPVQLGATRSTRCNPSNPSQPVQPAATVSSGATPFNPPQPFHLAQLLQPSATPSTRCSRFIWCNPFDPAQPFRLAQLLQPIAILSTRRNPFNPAQPFHLAQPLQLGATVSSGATRSTRRNPVEPGNFSSRRLTNARLSGHGPAFQSRIWCLMRRASQKFPGSLGLVEGWIAANPR